MSPTSPINPAEESVKEQPTPIWMKRVPMVTGVLAGLAGFLTVKSGNLSHQANYFSTQAVLHQERASDAWAEYQADSVKRHIDQVAVETSGLDPKTKAALAAEAKDLRDNRQNQKQADAHHEESLCTDALAESDKRLSIKDVLENYAGSATQLGIVLASIAALTRRKAAFTAGVVVGLVAIGITGYALLEPYVWRLLHR